MEPLTLAGPSAAEFCLTVHRHQHLLNVQAASMYLLLANSRMITALSPAARPMPSGNPTPTVLPAVLAKTGRPQPLLSFSWRGQSWFQRILGFMGKSVKKIHKLCGSSLPELQEAASEAASQVCDPDAAAGGNHPVDEPRVRLGEAPKQVYPLPLPNPGIMLAWPNKGNLGTRISTHAH